MKAHRRSTENWIAHVHTHFSRHLERSCQNWIETALAYLTYQNKSLLGYRLKKIKFCRSWEQRYESPCSRPCCVTTADSVMMTMTGQNQHLTDERVDYSTALELNNAWTFPTCPHSLWQVVIAWALTSFCKHGCLYSDLLTYQNWSHELMVNSQGSSHNITTHPILRLQSIDSSIAFSNCVYDEGLQPHLK